MRNRQRPVSRSRIQAQVKLTLPGSQPLPRHRLQQLQLRVIVSRADVLDIAGPATGGVPDLDRSGTRRRLHRPHIRHRASLRPPINAQIRPPQTRKPQVT
jgi:hypothetical protein